MSDVHNPKFLGAAGHTMFVRDADSRMRWQLPVRALRRPVYALSLLRAGARRRSPCGRYKHEIGYWDNADGYDGAIPSWHHRLRDAGIASSRSASCTSAARPGDDHGFSQEIVPMHIVEASAT
jgi:choline-sulfatase